MDGLLQGFLCSTILSPKETELLGPKISNYNDFP